MELFRTLLHFGIELALLAFVVTLGVNHILNRFSRHVVIPLVTRVIIILAVNFVFALIFGVLRILKF